MIRTLTAANVTVNRQIGHLTFVRLVCICLQNKSIMALSWRPRTDPIDGASVDPQARWASGHEVDRLWLLDPARRSPHHPRRPQDLATHRRTLALGP